GEKVLRMGEAVGQVLRCLGPGVVMAGQSLDLLGIEYRVGLEEGNFLGRLLAAVGIGVGFLEGAGINNGGALLALLDKTAGFLGLVEGKPDRAAIALVHGGGPQDQDVDSLVSLAVVTKRAGNPAGGMGGVPRLVPRADAGFQLGDDVARDAVVHVFPFGR